MTDTTFPAPPAPPRPPEASAPPPEPQNPATRAGTRALAITISVLGGGALVVGGIGVGLGTAGATIASGLTEATSQAVSAAGATEVVADVGAGRLDIEFGGGDEAVLEATGAEGAWTFERRGEKIVVSAPGRALDLFGWHIDPAATLTLPRSAEGIDLAIDLAAGSVSADGEFGAIAYDMGAGDVELEGSATALDATMAAGLSTIELDGLRRADFDVSAGALYGELTGEAPDEMRIEMTAGSFELEVPDVPYAVDVEREAGGFESNLDERRDAERTIDVLVSAGFVNLIAG